MADGQRRPVVAVGVFLPGVRFDSYALDPDENDPIYLSGNDGIAPPVAMNDSAVSPRIGVVGKFTEELSAYGQFARGFRHDRERRDPGASLGRSYSARRARIGSMRAARRAGIQLAASATRSSAAATAAKVSGSPGRTP